MNLETVTRPMEMFRDQMLRLGVQWAKQGRHVSQIALRSSAHAFALTAEHLDSLAARLADDVPAVADGAPVEEAPVEAVAPAVEAAAAEHVDDASVATDVGATVSTGGPKKKHRRGNNRA